jgi:hypothetical protein
MAATLFERTQGSTVIHVDFSSRSGNRLAIPARSLRRARHTYNFRVVWRLGSEGLERNFAESRAGWSVITIPPKPPICEPGEGVGIIGIAHP